MCGRGGSNGGMVVCEFGSNAEMVVRCVRDWSSSCGVWWCECGFGSSGSEMVVYECGWDSYGMR